MAWTVPRTYTTGELITAAILNTHVRDNFNVVNPIGWTFVIDGGGAAITTGSKGFAQIPVAACLQEAYLVTDGASSIEIRLAKDSQPNFPPASDTDSIIGSSPLRTSSAISTCITTLTTWAPSLAAADWVGYWVVAASGVKWAGVGLKANRN